MIFGQVVVGPPGSGKSTYCQAARQFLESTGRPVAVVNLDPANESPEYEYEVNINDLIGLTDVMEAFQLGPNGGLMYCIEYLEKNVDWLQDQLSTLEDKYVLLDCPGQAEMYTHHSSVFSILAALTRPLDLRLVSLHLVDASHCTDPQKYLSAVFLSLNTMMRLELPAVNVLSKVDLLPDVGDAGAPTAADGEEGGEEGAARGASAFDGGLLFALDYYQEAQDLPALLHAWGRGLAEEAEGVGGGWAKRTLRMYTKMAEVVEDYGMVTFSTLAVGDKTRMAALTKTVDRANGYAYGALGEQSRLADMAAASGGGGASIEQLAGTLG